MGQTTKPAPVIDAIEDDVEEAIRVCNGDARLAVRGLILGQRQIEAEAEKAVSAGYVRRRLIEQAAIPPRWPFPSRS